MKNNQENPKQVSFIEDQKIFLLAIIVGGLVQLGVESKKILDASDPAKFPNGWESMSIVEELIEGSIPTLAGAIAGKIIYKIIVSKTDKKYDRSEELKYISTCASIGYFSIVPLGAFIHFIQGSADVNWYPF